MPNRILREGILTSERVNSLGWEAEVFYRRLMSVVDDFGRYTAHPSLLRAALYPLKLETVRDANLERLLASVEQARLVRVYEVEGKRYLEVLDFRQQVRAKVSKWPAPGGGMPSACAADAQQTRSMRTADAPVFGDGDGDGDGTPGGAQGAPGRGGVVNAAPTAAGLVCRALKAAGIARCNPAHPMLLALLEAGASTDEFLGAVGAASGKRDPFGYVLAVVKGQREEAAQAAAGLHRGPLPAASSTVGSADADKTAAYLEELARHRKASRGGGAQARDRLRAIRANVVGGDGGDGHAH